MAYLAPEQADNPHGADTRADIYSLGCTLYHMLTGQVPFAAARWLDVLIDHRTKEPTPVTELVPAVPPELGDVVATMMAKSPDDRYQTPGEVVDALAAFRTSGSRYGTRRTSSSFQIQPPFPSGRRWRNPFGDSRTTWNSVSPFSSW